MWQRFSQVSVGLAFMAALLASAVGRAQVADLSLDGRWETGVARQYSGHATVPGLANDPTRIPTGTLWYRRSVTLPASGWKHATLELGGARFAPTIYVNGTEVARTGGGMAPISLELASPAVAPGATIILEIALQSLADLDPGDASSVPAADRWRSDVSSEIWDHVRLHFSRETLGRVNPRTDFAGRRLVLEGPVPAGCVLSASLLDLQGHTVAKNEPGRADIALGSNIAPWSPDSPTIYRLRLELRGPDGQLADSREINWGLRDFRTRELHFELNNAPIELRGASVVWHRWLRDPAAHELAFDPGWFQRNIVDRLKSAGANTLRFHLGLPPEDLLDLCDRRGLMVQMEWPFFHGVKAARASMIAQWRSWLDVAMRHPSVVLVHPWNETEGRELDLAWDAMNTVLKEFPPMVVAHRDVLHVHKYWWSLFENLGLYYDSPSQFPLPIMVDEFGGNYIDRDGNPGKYPAVRETFLRFLGRNPTPARRLEFEAEANAKVAEYWRRLGAAGFAPFCALSSPEDGNDWFLGALADGHPKPVWAAMGAAWAQQSVSLEIWDRNFLPGQTVQVPIYFFNDTGTAAHLTAEVRVGSRRQQVAADVPAHGRTIVRTAVTFPTELGEWKLEAQLVGTPVISACSCRTLLPAWTKSYSGGALAPPVVGVGPAEAELRDFLVANHIPVVDATDARAQIILGSRATWDGLGAKNTAASEALAASVNRGVSIILLDVGPRDLGQGYKSGELGPLDGAPRVTEPKRTEQKFILGTTVRFTEMAEPESHFHPAAEDDSLWSGLPRESTWLWNGLRGGLVAPAADMEVLGLNAPAFLALWESRGADRSALSGKVYKAFELAGYYAFSARAGDRDAPAALRQKVQLLAADAPALQDRINPAAPIREIDLAAEYQASLAGGAAEKLAGLASCGKNLTRTPVVEIAFGPGKGRVILSQLLTAGRLRRGAAEPGLYGIRDDPAAEQFVLNLLARALPHAPR